MRNFSEYIREVLLHSKTKPKKVFSPEIFRIMGLIGVHLSHFGNNVNQLIKLAHALNKKGRLNIDVYELFNQQMTDYLKTRKELIKVFRSIMRG